jgi:hypothetical protein
VHLISFQFNTYISVFPNNKVHGLYVFVKELPLLSIRHLNPRDTVCFFHHVIYIEAKGTVQVAIYLTDQGAHLYVGGITGVEIVQVAIKYAGSGKRGFNVGATLAMLYHHKKSGFRQG